MKTKNFRKSGFTPLEIIIVVVIVVVLVAMAIPNFVKPSWTAHKNSCLSNLKQIDSAKQQWAKETKQDATAVPADSDIYGASRYIRALPFCPLGGNYSLNAVSAKPTCSRSGAPDFHTL